MRQEGYLEQGGVVGLEAGAVNVAAAWRADAVTRNVHVHRERDLAHTATRPSGKDGGAAFFYGGWMFGAPHECRFGRIGLGAGVFPRPFDDVTHS